MSDTTDTGNSGLHNLAPRGAAVFDVSVRLTFEYKVEIKENLFWIEREEGGVRDGGERTRLRERDRERETQRERGGEQYISGDTILHVLGPIHTANKQEAGAEDTAVFQPLRRSISNI